MKSIFFHGLTVLLSLTSTMLAHENQELGRMWIFGKLPLTFFEKEYGFRTDKEWLDAYRFSSLSICGEDNASGFGFASFVSPKDLIITNILCMGGAVVLFLDDNGAAWDRYSKSHGSSRLQFT